MSGLKTGVVGVGRLGREHARILAELPGSHLVGVHDVDRARGREVAGAVDVDFHESLDGLLAAADAVVVAVPTSAHHPVGRRCLEAGCHTLMEKPLTPTLEEADDLLRLASEQDVFLGAGHVERFNGAVRACRQYLDRPRFLESVRLAPFQRRGTDVTVILDLMIHDIDLVLGLVDQPVAQLHAVGVPVLTESVDIANARLVFEDGSVADITASRVSMDRKRELRVFQDSGYLSLDLAGERGEFLRRRDGSSLSSRPEGLADVVERLSLDGDGSEPLRLELEAFLAAVRGSPSRLVSGPEARDALEIALEITREIEGFKDVALETA